MGYKILLADDSVTVQKIITLTFSDEGVDVMAVNNGDEAISRLHYMRPALVMADVSIPGRNGYEICEFVKNHPEMKNTPVILLVPAFEPFDEERARRIGADYHLTKPFQSIRTLISTVKNLVERKTDDEFSVVGSGLTAVGSHDHNNSEAAEIDPKRAKIEELIRLSSQAVPENGAEDEVLLEVDLTQNDGRYSDSLSVTGAPDAAEMPDAVEITDATLDMAIEDPPARPAVAAAVAAGASGGDMDNVLELDDVLFETVPAQTAQAIVSDGLVGDRSEPPSSAEPSEKQQSMTIPQSVIDEIVNRVATQLSEKLYENLSGEIASRIAPEVVEIVRSQLSASPAVYRDPENLLDID